MAPRASGVTETIATPSIAVHLTSGSGTAAWWYKSDQNGAHCTLVAAGTSTAGLTSLSGGTDTT